MSPSPLPPPGWYADPAGTAGSRWWDGAAWTEHVRSAPPGDDPPPIPGHLDGGLAGEGADGLPLGMSRGTRATAVVASFALVVGLAAAVAIGLRTTEQPDAPAPLERQAVAARAEAAGCVVRVDGEPLEDRSHLDPADAPPPEALYPARPAHSGQHFGTVLPLPRGTAAAPLDERAVLHNMEHGAVVVWFDTSLSEDQRRAVAAWRDERHALGFASSAGGAVFASPMPALDDPPTVALRAWGVALDCDRFDPVVADAFLLDHWGSHGSAPEANLSPFPDGSLEYREDG